MESLDVYQIISHFQNLHSEKLVVYNSDDITIYIAESAAKFLDKYEEKRYRPMKIPFRTEKYIECILDGASYIVVCNESTEYLLE